MKNHLFPPTGLLFNSLAILSLGVMAADTKAAADNAANNARDKSGETKTLMDQSNRPEDLRLMQEIRKVLIDDDSLSFDAKEVKIITACGRVTLRGMVDSLNEKTKIGALAEKCAGTGAVVNQIEIKDIRPAKSKVSQE